MVPFRQIELSALSVVRFLTDGPIWSGQDCPHFVRSEFGQMDGPVWGGRDSPHFVPYGFWQMEGLIRGGRIARP